MNEMNGVRSEVKLAVIYETAVLWWVDANAMLQAAAIIIGI